MSLGVALDSLFLILFRSSGKFRSSIALSFAFRRRLQAVRHFVGFFCFFVRRMLQLFFLVCRRVLQLFGWCMLQLLDLPCIWAYGLGFIPLFNPIQRYLTKKNPIQRPKQQKGGCDSVFYDDELTTTSRWLKCYWIVGLSLHSSQYWEIHNEIFCWRI